MHASLLHVLGAYIEIFVLFGGVAWVQYSTGYYAPLADKFEWLNSLEPNSGGRGTGVITLAWGSVPLSFCHSLFGV